MRSAELDTVLVVDDDESLRTLLGLILEAAGVNAICVASASEALDALENADEPVQALLLDLNLEHARGEDFLVPLSERYPSMAVFMISGCLNEEIEERIGNRPIDGIISKPFQSSELVQTISNGVAKRRELVSSGESA